MTYDSFGRGPHPVGVRSVKLLDGSRDRSLPAEIWYPATDTHRGQDLADDTKDRYSLLIGLPAVTQDAVRDAKAAPGSFPLLLFSHGYSGHRRQSTFYTTHLASHGYVVAALDHTGNTLKEIVEQTLAAQQGTATPSILDNVVASMAVRPDDAIFLLGRVLDGTLGGLVDRIDADRIGMTGHSFGGWTTLTTIAREPRIDSAVVLAPAGGHTVGIDNPMSDAIELDWGRDVPTLFLAADQENVLTPESVTDLFERTAGPKHLLTLANSDHFHFCDRAGEAHEIFRAMPWPGGGDGMAERLRPFADLIAAEPAYDFTRATALAHFDATLKSRADARTFLDETAVTALEAHGARVLRP